MNLKRILLPLVLLPMLMLPGCKLVTAAPTPGVPQFYSQAALVLSDFSGILNQAQTLFTSAHTSGLVSETDYLNGQRAFLQIATAGNNLDTLVSSEASQPTVIAAISSLIQQVGAMPTAFAIKSPTAQAEFTALCTSMQTILQAAETIIQTTTTPTTTTAVAAKP